MLISDNRFVDHLAGLDAFQTLSDLAAQTGVAQVQLLSDRSPDRNALRSAYTGAENACQVVGANL
jgi:hypothetical protein